jgi:hypothetical protein
VGNFLLYFIIIVISLGPMGVETCFSSAGPEGRDMNLDLTPGQVQALKDLNVQFYREQSQLREKIIIKRMEARNLSPDDFRGEKGEEIRSQIQSFLFQVRERSLFYRQEAFKVLTPEQRKKISTETDLGFHCRGWLRRGGRWGAGSGSGGPGPAPSQ